ncbi:MAG: metal ABC transporter substrate-binding protein [Myxococcota bacterium]|jgi:ABC-type Zn uptake system ZnuABC Zn-binding protein ZnuA|nr:metal ABC transporter substrate-binding protein [Myxococcota bacterium]
MKQKKLLLFVALLCGLAVASARDADAKIKVVVTNSAYTSIAQAIGGDQVQVTHIVEGNQDPHIVRPKPSLAVLLKEADLYVTTGMDLEMWSPALIDMSGNPQIRSGQKGYVSASAGLKIVEQPVTISRAEGDVHIYGNPHIHTSPLNGKVIAENICVGLKRVAPEHAAVFDANLAKFKDEVDRRTFGPELVKVLGGKTLTDLAQSGRLIPFLEKKQYKGQPLLSLLGGWMKEGLPLRGLKIVAFHKNITYFADLFGIDIVDYMEPKPGIPPTPGHITTVMEKMRSQNIKVMWAENYFDVAQVKRVAAKVDAVPVIVALGPGGQPGMDTFFDMFDIWLRELNAGVAAAARR